MTNLNLISCLHIDHCLSALYSSTIFLTALIAIALDVNVGLQAVYEGILPFPPT